MEKWGDREATSNAIATCRYDCKRTDDWGLNHSEGQSAFCELMIKARKNAGLSQHELTRRLHKPQSLVAKYEGGERRVDVVEFLTVCQAIGVDSTKILKTLSKAVSRSF